MIAYKAWQPKTADTEILQQCKESVCRVLPDAEVILYGSRAEETPQTIQIMIF